LSEATGKAVDECFAAFLQYGGSLEQVAERMFEEMEKEGREGSASSGSSAVPSSSSLGSGLESSGPAGSSTVSATMAEVMALEKGQEQRAESARQWAEMTGKSEVECRAALEAHGGRADAAAEYLLGLFAAEGSSSSSSSQGAAGAEVSSAAAGAESRAAAPLSDRDVREPGSARVEVDVEEQEADLAPVCKRARTSAPCPGDSIDRTE